MDINTIGQIAEKVAEYLKLQDPKYYTGHVLRRTSSILLANIGVDVIALQRHCGHGIIKHIFYSVTLQVVWSC